MNKNSFKFIALASVLWSAGAGCAGAQQVDRATAISEVFGDGAKITTAILSYSEPVDGSKLAANDFSVKGREISRVYASETEAKGQPATTGRYVVIELQTRTELKPVRPDEQGRKIQGPVAGQIGMNNSNRRNGPAQPVTDSVVVSQVSPVYTIGGKAKAMSQPLVARSSHTLIADDFKQLVYHDQATGIDLAYNLYVPQTIEPGKHYPLVIFIHDASGAGRDVKNTLLQGNGATVWASPEWQSEHPCFVLAPQFAQVTVDDNYNTTPDLDACIHLLDSLISANPVDADRVYTTGQSMGCMSSYVLMLRRPDLFASAMLVAGQWNPEVMAPLAKKNLWLLSCKGDVKSSEGVAQAMKVWQAHGAKVVEQEWPLEATKEQRAQEVADMLRQGGNIHYTHFTGGSHNNTWRVAYDIDGVRQWLFEQHR